MAKLTPSQETMRARFESAISVAAPFLDIVIGVGERISRIAEPTDYEYYPVQPGGDRRLPGETEPGKALERTTAEEEEGEDAQ